MGFTFGPQDMNWLAILAAIVAYMVLGSLWFGPWFGRSWAREMNLEGVSEEQRRRELPRALLLMLAGAFLLAFALRFVTAAFTPAYWLPDGKQLGWGDAWLAGCWAWLGYFVPVQLGRVAWEGRSWRLFRINTSFFFVVLSAMALILGLWV